MNFYVENLTLLSIRTGLDPWDYKTDEVVSVEVRRNKNARQSWYRDTAVRHNFYTFFEGCNPRQRVNKENNPPVFIHGFAADFDCEIHDADVQKAIAQMDIKPAWVETSLGNHRRLVWLLTTPISCGDYAFAVFIQQRAVKWLQLHLLPSFDEPCFIAPERLLCNGLIWEKVGAGVPINEAVVQSFFVECGRAYNFRAQDATTIPLSVIEDELRKKYPRMADWPEAFDYEAPGPSFWLEGSESPRSALVKKDGMFSFAAHASKPFFSWTELLGAEFVKKFTTEQMGNATRGIYWDGKCFWKYNPSLKKMGTEDKDGVSTYLRVNLLLSSKPEKDGVSQIDKALDHIRGYNRIHCAAPVMFRPPGVHIIGGNPVLNTLLDSHVLEPSAEPGVWGAAGNFPHISLWLDNLFEPHSQLAHNLSWLAFAYRNAKAGSPNSGQAVFLAGGPSMGKTLYSTCIVGGLFCGWSNGAKYITGNDPFGGEVFNSGVICVDDETVSSSDNQRVKMEAMVKQLVANPIQRVHVKFQMPMLTEWRGRLIISCNLDMVALRVLPSLSEGMRDKVCFYRVAQIEDRPELKFPSKDEITEILKAELPFFANWLMSYEIPTEFLGDSRFGIKAFHDPSLKEASYQSTKTATFYELLLMSLNQFFIDNPECPEFRATTTLIHKIIITNPFNQELLRAMRVEQVGRYLEQVQREGLLVCRTETIAGGLRSWVFPRFPALNLSPMAHEHSFNKPVTA